MVFEQNSRTFQTEAMCKTKGCQGMEEVFSLGCDGGTRYRADCKVN